MKIYRSILLNEGETINTENIGTSWTLCHVFADDHANDIIRANEKEGYVILEAEINDCDIDWSNTLYAMETRPNEFEVVLSGGEIKAEVIYSENTSIEEGDIVDGFVGSNNFEDYCDSYEGDLSKEDFITLASEF